MHDLAEMRHIRRRRTRICFDCFFQELGSKNHLNIQNQTHILFCWHGWILVLFVFCINICCVLALSLCQTQKYMRITNVKKVLIGLKEMGNVKNTRPMLMTMISFSSLDEDIKSADKSSSNQMAYFNRISIVFSVVRFMYRYSCQSEVLCLLPSALTTQTLCHPMV